MEAIRSNIQSVHYICLNSTFVWSSGQPICHCLVKGEDYETQPVLCFMPRNDPPGMRPETNCRPDRDGHANPRCSGVNYAHYLPSNGH